MQCSRQYCHYRQNDRLHREGMFGVEKTALLMVGTELESPSMHSVGSQI